MKNKASGFLKQIMGVLTFLAKAKTLALKTKSNALKARLLFLSLLRNRKLLMTSISHKLHNLLGPRGGDDREGEDSEELADHAHMAIALYTNTMMARGLATRSKYAKQGDACEDGEEDKYPDLSRSLFQTEDFEDPGGSVIDIVKKAKGEGEEFDLEEEIDTVADLFIRRFHRQIRLQKQLSLKRLQDMVDTGA